MSDNGQQSSDESSDKGTKTVSATLRRTRKPFAVVASNPVNPGVYYGPHESPVLKIRNENRPQVSSNISHRIYSNVPLVYLGTGNLPKLQNVVQIPVSGKSQDAILKRMVGSTEETAVRDEKSEEVKNTPISKPPRKFRVSGLDQISSPERTPSKNRVAALRTNFEESGRKLTKADTQIPVENTKKHTKDSFLHTTESPIRVAKPFSPKLKPVSIPTVGSYENINFKRKISGALYYSPTKAMENRCKVQTVQPESTHTQPICAKQQLELADSNLCADKNKVLSNVQSTTEPDFLMNRRPPKPVIVGSLFKYSLSRRNAKVYGRRKQSLAFQSSLSSYSSDENTGVILPRNKNEPIIDPAQKLFKISPKSETSVDNKTINLDREYSIEDYSERSIVKGRKIYSLPGLENDERRPRGELLNVQKRSSPPKRPDHMTLLNDLIEESLKLTEVLHEIGTDAPYIASAFKLIALECPEVARKAFTMAKLTSENGAFSANLMYFTSKLARMNTSNFSRSVLEDAARPVHKSIGTIYSVCIMLSEHCDDLQAYYSNRVTVGNRPHLYNKSRSWTTTMQFATSSKKLTDQIKNIKESYYLFQRAHRRINFYIRDVDFDEIIVLSRQSIDVCDLSRTQREIKCQDSKGIRGFIRRVPNVGNIFKKK